MEVVLADVGDMQTIVDDLSTYSAHLVAQCPELKEHQMMLVAARRCGENIV